MTTPYQLSILDNGGLAQRRSVDGSGRECGLIADAIDCGERECGAADKR